MDGTQRRHRSSTAASKTLTSTNPYIDELRALIEILNSTIPQSGSSSTSETIQAQCNALRRVRQVLVDSENPVQTKDAFRHVLGFDALLDTIRSTSGVYEPDKLSEATRSEFFELLKAALDVLSQALTDHPGNRRYFVRRVEGGGWRALEQALASTGIGAASFAETHDSVGQEQFFGCLFAFAVGEDSIHSIFRGVSIVTSEKTSTGSNGTAKSDETDAFKATVQSAKKKPTGWTVFQLEDKLRRTLSGKEVLQNPDVIPIVLSFWKIMSTGTQDGALTSPLSVSILMALRDVSIMSTHNKYAAHTTGMLSTLLHCLYREQRHNTERSLIRGICEALAQFGINQLSDAHLLYEEASRSSEAGKFLLKMMRHSRDPAFIQFDLSIHGYSSIELRDLGRPFPPSSGSGYTIAAWVRVDRFDKASHTTIFGACDATQQCFVLAYLERETKHFILQTSVTAAKPSVRFRFNAFQEGRWYHIAIVHRRPTAMTSSKAALFVDGDFTEHIKCSYPARPPVLNPSAESFASLTTGDAKLAPVQAFLGTPQDLASRLGRNVVATRLSMASFHIFQEAISDEMVAVYQKLGPRYNGNYQDTLGSFQTYRASAELNIHNELLHPGKEEKSEIVQAVRGKAGQVLPESQILFSISPVAVMDDDDRNGVDESQLIKSLSKNAAASLHNYTRVGGNAIVINAAIPSINDALMQPRGVALLLGDPIVVVPQALDDAVWRLGGCVAVGLKLVELAQDKEGIIRAVRILLESVEQSWRNSEIMEKESGFAVLATILREKLGLGTTTNGPSPFTSVLSTGDRDKLSQELLEEILRFIGYDKAKPEDSIIINPLAYRVLVADTDIWRKCPIETQKLYYDQFVHFAQGSKHSFFNQRRLARTRIVKRLLDAFKGDSLAAAALPSFSAAFKALLKCSLTAENLRCTSLFVTFCLQDGRATVTRSLTKRRSHANLGGRGTPPTSSPLTGTPRSASPQHFAGATLSRQETGIKILEIFTDILCDANSLQSIGRFAKTITNKWLLYLFAENDPRVIVLSLKILARLLIASGPSYVKKFGGEKTGGFHIMKQRLRTWWHVPAVWTLCFATFFGRDPTKLDLERDFDLFNLAELFAPVPKLQVLYPEILPVIGGILETGLRAIVKDQADSQSAQPGGNDERASLKAEAVTTRKRSMSLLEELASKGRSPTPSAGRIDGYAVILKTVLQFLSDIHSKSTPFQDFALSSSYVQELLFVLYPVVVTSDTVSAEIELHSRGSALTFDGQDVVIQSHSKSATEQSAVVRTSVVESPLSPNSMRTIPLRRGSSFVLVSRDKVQQSNPTALLEPPMSPTKSGTKALQVGNAVVEALLELVLGVFTEQLFQRKEFAGFGLFLKVPPGFQEHQAYFESYILLHAMSNIKNSLQLDQTLFTEPRVLMNLSKYVSHMAEAIFEGWFLNGAEPLLDFTGTLLDFLQRPEIAKLKSVRLCSQAIANIRTVFLRVVLLRLSDRDDPELDHSAATFLEKMIYWQTIILSPENAEVYFLKLMCYLLYTKLLSKSEAVRDGAANFWRLLLVQKPSETSTILADMPIVDEKRLTDEFLSLTQLDNAAFFQWIEAHQTQLDAFFFGNISKIWEEFVAEENRRTRESAKSRVTKRRERLKQWHAFETTGEDVWHRHETSTAHWRTNIHSSERLKHQRLLQDTQDNLAFVNSRIQKLDRVLQGPCGLFAKPTDRKWQLDETEGRNRMRMRILPETEPPKDEYQPKRSRSESTPKSKLKLDVNVPKVTTSPSAVSASPAPSRPGINRQNSNGPNDGAEQTEEPGAAGEDEEFEMVEDINEGENGFEDKNRKVMRSLQMGDQVQHVSNISRIVGLEAIEGLLIIGNGWLYLLDNFFQRSDGEIVRVWQAPPEERDTYVQMISGREASAQRSQNNTGEQTTRNWTWGDVISISKRRFLFREVGIEIFFGDGRSYLLTAISPTVRNDLYARLVSRAPHVHSPSTALQMEDAWRLDSLRNPEEAPQTLGSKFANVFNSSAWSPATKRWLKGEISNFNYLMLINTLAGRTFNDLTQYPVFPWVIADYTSEELDLTNSKSFRDLSKPMGCQTASREAEFRDRYQSFAEMGDHNAPPFHYGTHYSSAMIVTSYLIRLQPFVQAFLLLQGGSFDHADRMFYSIERAWLSASRDTMTDVRELTPEFFYLPEFLTNINGYNFGSRQTAGQKIDDVVLPPWAKGDPKLFITKNREALESPYVTRHLHQWIDLVFGYKQRGEAAVAATNVFHHLSYHGAKDLDNIEDPVERLATIGIIHNFGQTPHQIFQRAHVAREDLVARFKRLDNSAESLTKLPFPLLESHERVASLLYSQKHDRLLCSAAFRLNMPPMYDRYMEWGFTDHSVRFYATDSKKLIGLFEHLHQGQISAASFLDSRVLVTAGVDCTLSLWSLGIQSKAVDLQPKVTLFGHKAPVNVLATSRAFSTLLSADTSGRVYLWDLNRHEFVRELGNDKDNERDGPVQCARISNVTGHIMICRGAKLQLYTLNGRLLLSEKVCETSDWDDVVTSCAVYEGVGNEWITRELLFTGHRRGVVNVWTPKTNAAGKWYLSLVTTLNHVDGSREERVNTSASISCILPIAQVVYTGDEDGRVVSFEISSSREEWLREEGRKSKRKSAHALEVVWNGPEEVEWARGRVVLR